MNTLNRIILDSLEGRLDSYGYMPTNKVFKKDILTLVVPAFSQTFEIPAFLLKKFCSIVNYNADYYDALAIPIKSIGYYSSYTTLDAKIKHLFNKPYERKYLISLKSKSGEVYYITNGAIFDKLFNPIAVLSWIIEKSKNKERNAPLYKFVRPILRIDPNIFIQKADDVQRYIINKIIPETLVLHVYEPYIPDNSLLLGEEGKQHSVKIEVDKIPFIFKQVETPSITTTNKTLLQTVINNIEELSMI